MLYNWADELESWGHFRVGKFHRNAKEEVIAETKKGKLEVVLTTHETMRLYLVSMENLYLFKK